MNADHFCPQEVFEARYVKIPQEASYFPHPCSDRAQGETVGMLSTTSDSESCSEAEGPSEQVAEQLANLKERVSITHWLYKWPFSGVFLLFCEGLVSQLKVVSHQLSRLTQVPSKKRKSRLKREKISKNHLRSKHKSSRCKIVIKRMGKTKSSALWVCQNLHNIRRVTYIFSLVLLLICCFYVDIKSRRWKWSPEGFSYQM